MSANTITIKFKPEGHEDLKKAIDAISRSQEKLNKSSEVVTNTTKKTKAEFTKLNTTYVTITSKVRAMGKSINDLGLSSEVLSQAMRGNQVAVEKLKMSFNKLNTTTRVLGGSFAVIRSKLLLISFGTGLVSDSVLKLVNLYAEQELAEKRLTVALGFRSKALIEQASALQAQTRFGDEAIIGAQAMLAAFIKDEDQLKKATKATLDLAAAKGMDLKTAADLVAKSVGSSTNSLTRYGIEAKGAAGSSERLESITGNIKKLFGGFAEGELNTARGMLDATANAVGDAGENFGRVLLPPVLLAARALKLVSEATSPERIKAYGLAIAGLAIAYNRAAIATAAFTMQVNLSRAALIKSGYGIAVVVLGELASRFVFASEKIEDNTEKITQNTKAIDESNEEVEKNIANLKRQLQVLILNANELDRKALLQKVLIESDRELTQEEIDLHKRIIDITVARREETEEVKNNNIQIKEHIRFRKEQKRELDSLLSHEAKMQSIRSQQAVINLKLNKADESTVNIANARANVMSQLVSTHKQLSSELGTQHILNTILTEQGHDNLKRIVDENTSLDGLNDKKAQEMILIREKIKAILEVLAATESLIAQQEEQDGIEKSRLENEILVNNQLRTKIETLNMTVAAFNAVGNAARHNMNVELQALRTSDNYKNASRKRQQQLEEGIREKYADQQKLAFRANQAGAIANVAFNTADAVSRAIVAFPPTGLPWSAIIKSMGAVQIAAIMSQKMPQYEYGGLIGGRRHSAGGTVIEAEQGEFVVNRNAVESIGIDNLEMMNSTGSSGVTVNITGNVMSSDFVENELAEKIQEAVRKGVDFGVS